MIFYSENGYIYHVVMYIGDGQVVHASSSATGIKVSNLYRNRPFGACVYFNERLLLTADRPYLMIKSYFTIIGCYAILNKYEHSPDSGIGNSDRFLIRGDYKKIWRNIQ